MMDSNKNFWEKRYEENRTGWDIGEISTPLKNYIDQLQDQDLKILIPGGGNSYEAEYLFQNGFKNVHVVDIASQPLQNLKNRVPDFPESQLHHENFFSHQENYDLILEQTFFCALQPKIRASYAEKVSELLEENGKIAGILFNFEFTNDGPPFGGSKDEYLTYFSPYFKIDIFEECYNSIPPRQGKELFFKFSKKPEA
ncbi:MAG: SAM-dependent methyltransferase [Christiangramia sp.]|uniref:SAM-dependent methyltransferase n=1 Tax=Christiangramia sp. TaxID=1931228 RepID=UPI003241BCD8